MRDSWDAAVSPEARSGRRGLLGMVNVLLRDCIVNEDPLDAPEAGRKQVYAVLAEVPPAGSNVETTFSFWESQNPKHKPPAVL